MTDATPPTETYNAFYYHHGCGLPYERTPGWLKFFSGIAERIVQVIAPRTVLDAGCALGFLVEGLRDQGVEAYGVDISHFAIGQVREDLKPYCWQGSVTDPFPQKYDLIVCIEVLEHMPQAEAEAAIANFCRHTDDIVFSSTPNDYKEVTHFNVQPPEYWAEQFARHGFLRDVDYDATFITAWAVRFVRRTAPVPRLVRDYERRFWLNHKEAADLRALAQDMRDQLDSYWQQKKQWEAHTANLQTQLQLAHENAQAQLQSMQRAHAELQHEYQHLQQLYNQLAQDHTALQAQWQAMQQTLSWKVLQTLWRTTAQLAPPGSLPERTLRQLIGWLRQTATELTSERPNTYLGQFVFFWRKHGLFAALRRGTEVGRALWQERQRLLQQRIQAQLPAPPNVFIPPVLAAPPDLQPHQHSADIVVCIHNALPDVQNCLESIVRYTRLPYRLILVDDGSAAPTQAYLTQFALEQGAQLLRNEQAQGYTLAANQGLRASTGAYVVLLNSDTLVTPYWLDRLIACADSDHAIGLVGPLSNTASWQSVPERLDAQGDWADNPLPPNVPLPTWAAWLAAESQRLYPRMGFLNGFCLLLKRQVLVRLGVFDEATFGQGYGEENDYCLRATAAGYQLAVADDVYIYHAQSRSYSHERRRALSAQADRNLRTKHSEERILAGLHVTRQQRELAGVRARSRVLAERQQFLQMGKARWEGRRVAFVLPIAEAGGGGNVIFQEAQAMRQMGVEVQIFNLTKFRSFFAAAYPELTQFITYLEHPHEIEQLLPQYDAWVATFHRSVEWLSSFEPQAVLPTRAYYIQDYEPSFYPTDAVEYEQARASYTRLPGLVRITKTEWNRNMVRTEIGVDCVVVGPSVNLDLCRPRPRRDGHYPARPLRVAAMIRPSSPRRQAAFTMEVLGQVQRARRANLEVILFGCDSRDPDFVALPQQFTWRNAGIVTPQQLATLLNECDIFVDFSSYQAMGLTALEAMATGLAVIVPQTGGADSFARPELNCLMVDTANATACAAALDRLLDNHDLRSTLQTNALHDSAHYFPEKAAYRFLEALWPTTPAPIPHA